LQREVQAALKHADIIERLRAMDSTPVGMIGPEVQARLKAIATLGRRPSTANAHLD
jgi:hypothetical protein